MSFYLFFISWFLFMSSSSICSLNFNDTLSRIDALFLLWGKESEFVLLLLLETWTAKWCYAESWDGDYFILLLFNKLLNRISCRFLFSLNPGVLYMFSSSSKFLSCYLLLTMLCIMMKYLYIPKTSRWLLPGQEYRLNSSFRNWCRSCSIMSRLFSRRSLNFV